MPTLYPTFAKEKHIIIPILLVLAAVIGFQSWKDLHPPPEKEEAAFSIYDVARDDKTVDALANSQNYTAFAVWLGSMKAGADGKAVYAPSPVALHDLPQQEIVALFDLSGLPDADSVADAVGAAVQKWTHEGSLANDIYLEYDGPQDLEKLTAFTKALRDRTHKEYFLALTLKAGDLEPGKAAESRLAELEKNVRTVIFDEAEAAHPGESLTGTITRLDAFQMSFFLKVKERPDVKQLETSLKDKTQNFAGFLIDPPAAATN